MKVLHLLDSQNNIVAVIHLKTELGTESKAKSFSDDIEFVGLFWTAYAHYFPAFCDLLGIDPAKSGIVSRFDYCVDLSGVDASEILALVSDKMAKASTIRVGNVETYRKIETPQRHALVVYNKRLDVLDKRKHKIEVDPVEPGGPLRRPYLRYVEARFPIARIEYRKRARALREMADSSIVSLQMYARQLAADHFSAYFEIDLQTVFETLSNFERVPFPSKEDTLVNGMVDDKAKAYLNLAFAYADNYSLLKGQKQFFRHLFQKYGTHLVDWVVRESDFEPVHNQAVYELFPASPKNDKHKRFRIGGPFR